MLFVVLVFAAIVSVMLLMSAPLALQFVLLTFVGLICLSFAARKRTFVMVGIVGSLIAILVPGILAGQRWTERRAEYPMQSLADRLSYELHPPKLVIDQSITLPDERLMKLDESYDQWRFGNSYSDRSHARMRTASLRQVHASQVKKFIESDGFGVGRMRRPSPSDLDSVRMPEPVPLPAESAPETSAEQEQDHAAPPLAPLASTLRSDVEILHDQSVRDFASPAMFGYIESRQQVAGFLPHAFSELPVLREQPQWSVRKVELVSLLKHERPMVYVSANLPNMSELGEMPVRPANAFEERGLVALLGGNDLEIESTAARIRMLGAIRAGKQCLDCHTVEHGALLGAFSYELRSSAAPESLAVEPEGLEPPL